MDSPDDASMEDEEKEFEEWELDRQKYEKNIYITGGIPKNKKHKEWLRQQKLNARRRRAQRGSSVNSSSLVPVCHEANLNCSSAMVELIYSANGGWILADD